MLLVKAVPQHHTEEQHTFTSGQVLGWLSGTFTGEGLFIYSDGNMQVSVKEILRNKETLFFSPFLSASTSSFFHYSVTVNDLGLIANSRPLLPSFQVGLL